MTATLLTEAEYAALFSTEQLCELAAISLRKADHWTRCGYLEPVGEAEPGTGYRRRFTEAEVEIARRIGRLTAAGLAPSVAAVMARQSWPVAEIGEGLVLIATEVTP